MLIRALTGGRRPLTRSNNFTLPTVRGWSNSLTGPIAVNEASVLALPVANRCVQIIADSIGSLPLQAQRGREMLTDTPALLSKPEASHTRVESISAMVVSLLLHGNAYAVVAERNYLGFPTSLVVMSPHAVSVRQLPDGSVEYRIAGRAYDPDDVLHVRGQTLPGSLTGMGVIELHRRAIAQATAAEDYAGELWTTGATPDGYLHSEQTLTREESEEFGTRFVQSHGGRMRRPPVLSGGMEYRAISWSNVDLEFLESRKWNGVQVCQAFGVPAVFAMVPSGDSKTYQTVTQDTRAFVSFTLRPWLTRLEEAFSEMLPRGQRAMFNLDALLRADTKERYEAHAIALSNGFMTVEEVRDLENLSPDDAPEPAPLAVVPEPDEEDEVA